MLDVWLTATAVRDESRKVGGDRHHRTGHHRAPRGQRPVAGGRRAALNLMDDAVSAPPASRAGQRRLARRVADRKRAPRGAAGVECDAGEQGGPAHGGVAAPGPAASEADAGTVGGGGPRAPAAGGDPARRPAAATGGREVPSEPAEQPGQGRPFAWGDDRPGRSDAHGRHREIAQPVPRAQSGRAVPGRLRRDPRWLAGQMQAKHGLDVHVDVLGAIDVAVGRPQTFLYRAAQEMLFNVVKHAQVNGPASGSGGWAAASACRSPTRGAVSTPRTLRPDRRVRAAEHPRARRAARRPDEDPTAPRARAARSIIVVPDGPQVVGRYRRG